MQVYANSGEITLGEVFRFSRECTGKSLAVFGGILFTYGNVQGFSNQFRAGGNPIYAISGFVISLFGAVLIGGGTMILNKDKKYVPLFCWKNDSNIALATQSVLNNDVEGSEELDNL